MKASLSACSPGSERGSRDTTSFNNRVASTASPSASRSRPRARSGSSVAPFFVLTRATSARGMP
jgi:hypothetical protein